MVVHNNLFIKVLIPGKQDAHTMPERYEIQDCIKKQKLEILENHNILADNA